LVKRTSSCGAASTVGREDAWGLVDGQVSSRNGELEGWGFRVYEAEALQGQILCEQVKCL